MNTQIKRKMHGSVLLTVVFVMSILIVFLFGTLALALAANNRAHVNYSSAQTSITARSVAESAIKAIENDTPQGKAYAKAIGKLSAGQTAEVAVELSGDKAGAYGTVDNVVISYAGTKKYYDVIKQEWLERDLLKFTATVNMSGVTSTSSVYVLKHYEEDDEGSGSGGAGFVTTADANFACQTSLFGGAYISLPKLDDAKKYVYTNDHVNRGFGDVVNVEIIPHDSWTEKKVTINKENGFYAVNSGSVIEADLYVNDNMYTENFTGIIFPSKKTGVTILGDMYFHNNAPSQLSYYYSGEKGDLNFNEVPFLYVDGKISGSPKIGNKPEAGKEYMDFPLNTFCGSIDIDEPNDFVIGGNLYCMDESGNNVIKGKNKTSLYAWSGSVLSKVKTSNPAQVVNGEICSNGNLELSKVEIKGDVRVRGDLTIGPEVTINGNVVCEGTLTAPDDFKPTTGKVYYDKDTKYGDPVTVNLPNEKGYYYIYNPIEFNAEGKYTDPKGNVLNDDKFTDGKPNEGVSSADLSIYYVMEEGHNPGEADAKDHIYLDRRWYSDDPNLKEAYGLTGQFYIETSVKPDTFKYKEDGNHEYEVETNYNNIVDSETFEYTFNIANGIEEFKKLSGEKTVYPQYALRTVITGKEVPDGCTNENVKIVKTVEEVLTKVSNPYKAVKMPDGIQAKYDKYYNADGTRKADGNAIYCDSVEKVRTLNGGKKIKDDSIDADGKYTVGTDDAAKGMYIETDCILDFAYGNGEKSIVINPGNTDILIVIDNFSTGADVNIMIDDSKGGNVYFYINKNGKFSIDKNHIITQTYKEAMNSFTKFKYTSTDTTDNADCKKISELKYPVPRVYMYGGDKSEFNVSNMKFITLNIISPELKVVINATNDPGIDKFYYNNTDIETVGDGARPYLIGCCNAHAVESNNMVNVVYITDGGDAEGDASATDDEFWYKPLYYHEF